MGASPKFVTITSTFLDRRAARGKGLWYSQSGVQLLASPGQQPHRAHRNPLPPPASSSNGPNELKFQKTPAWLRFLRQFNDPMVIILLATALVTGILTALGSHVARHRRHRQRGAAQPVLGFVQEGKAEGRWTRCAT